MHNKNQARMYLKTFEIRWSDVDANKHLANSAYVNFMSHTRMAFLLDLGFSYTDLEARQLGPIVLNENIYYFKEVFPGTPLQVSLEITGLSEDGMFFGFRHNFYDHKGRNVARGEMMGAWIDAAKRQLTRLPAEYLEHFAKGPKAKDFRVLTKDDTRAHGRYPKDLA